MRHPKSPRFLHEDPVRVRGIISPPRNGMSDFSDLAKFGGNNQLLCYQGHLVLIAIMDSRATHCAQMDESLWLR